MVERNYRREIEGFNAETVRLNTHTGTHVDVPFHFDDEGASVEQMPLSAFAAPAVFLDLRARVRAADRRPDPACCGPVRRRGCRHGLRRRF